MGLSKKVTIKTTESGARAATKNYASLGKSVGGAKLELHSYVLAARKANAVNTSTAVAKAAKGYRSAANDISSSVRGLSAGSAALTQIGATASKLVGPVGIAAVAVGGAAMAADRLSSATIKTQNVFNNLEFSIAPARRATQGLISDMQLATTANQAHALGVAKTGAEYAAMVASAQALGAKLNISTQSALDSLVAGVGRQSKLMLDNLGILIDVDAEQKKYAATIGKTAAKLNEAQRAEVFRAAALRKITAAAKEVTLVTDGAAAATQRYKVQLQNLASEALGATDHYISLSEGVKQLSEQDRRIIAQTPLMNMNMRDVQDTLRGLGVSYQDTGVDMERYRRALLAVESAEQLARLSQLKHAASLEGRRELFNTTVAQATAMNNALEEQLGLQERRDLDKLIAMLDGVEGAEREVNQAMHDKALIMIRELELQGELTEAAKMRHEEELRMIRAETKASSRRGGGSRLGADERSILRAQGRSGLGAFRQIRDDKNIIDDASNESIQSELFGGPQELAEPDWAGYVDRARDAEDARSEAVLSAKLRHVEMMREMGVEPLQLIESEEQARLEFLDRQLEMADTDAERVRAQNAIELEMHNSRLERMKIHEKETAKTAKRLAKLQRKVGTDVSQVMGATAQAMIVAGESGKQAAAEMFKGWAESKRNQLIVEAIVNTVLAVAAAARMDPVAAAQHGTAAAMAAAGAIVIGGMGAIAGAVASGGIGGGASAPSRRTFGASGVGRSGSGREDDDGGPQAPISVGNNSSRVPDPPTSTGQESRQAARTVVVHVDYRSLEAPDRESFGRELRQVIDESERNEANL